MSDTTFPSLKNLGDPERLACSMAIGVDTKYLAERVGFEPTIPVKVCPLSRRIVSTAHAPLRAGKTLNFQFCLAGDAPLPAGQHSSSYSSVQPTVIDVIPNAREARERNLLSPTTYKTTSGS